MRNRIALRARNGEEVFLCVPRRFFDSKRSVAAFPETDTDTALSITDNDDQTEVEPAATGHNTSNTPNINGDLVELAAFARSASARAARAQGTAAAFVASAWRSRFGRGPFNCRSDNLRLRCLRYHF